MASCTTPLWGTTSTCPRLIFTVTESSSTATTSTLSWTLQYYAGASGATTSNTKSYSAVIAGQTVSSGSYAINKKTGYHTIASGTKTINKGTSAQTISFSCSMGFNLSWSGTYGGTKSASGSISVSAKTQYTISYNANGGSGAPSSQTKWAGTNVTISSTKPTRTGYTFAGWATSSSGSVAYQPGSTYSANASVTLYAKWTALTYTVSYNANGGSGAPGAQTKTYGVNLTLSATKPTRANYNFKGWGVSAGTSTVTYAAGGTYTSNASITLYAVWELAYTAPRITGFSVDRCNSGGTVTESGTYAKVTFSWATDKTVSSIKIEYKMESSTSWTTITAPASGTSSSVNQVIGGSFSTEYSYNIKVTVSDTNGSSSSTKTVGAMSYAMDFLAGGGGVAFGKPATTDGFEVNMDARFLKTLSVGGKNILDELNTLKKYSTSESLVGIWIDGKNIYRKVISRTYNESDLSAGSGNTKTGILETGFPINYVDTITCFNIINKCVDGTVTQYYDGSGTAAQMGGDSFRAFFNVHTGKIQFICGTGNPRRPFTVIAILEYTKM